MYEFTTAVPVDAVYAWYDHELTASGWKAETSIPKERGGVPTRLYRRGTRESFTIDLSVMGQFTTAYGLGPPA